jgi:two-component system OmpR family response regulator
MPKKSAVPQDRKQKILLLDDDPMLQKLRSTILQRNGFYVDTAAAIAEARALWRPNIYDLVLVDVKSDVRSALDFCEEIKSESREQLFVVLSQPPLYIPPESCADEVISKEEGPHHFVTRVRELLASA